MARSIENTQRRIDRVNAEIHTSVAGFTGAVRKITKLMTQDMLLAFHQKISLDALRKVVTRTPVDTGRARGGWQSSIKGFRDGTERIDPTPFGEDGGPAIQVGLRVIDSLKPYGAYYLSNSVPYILFLEDGHSRQSRDMVKLAVEELKREILV